jgi:hypothetical protein
MSALSNAGYPDLILPECNVKRGFLDGRNIYEGYQRGAGLEYGDLRQQIDVHPLFVEALAVARDRTLVSADRIRNMFLILTTFLEQLPSQNCIEFGSYRGGMVFFAVYILNKLYPEAQFWSFDTFEGMPETDKTLDLHSSGDFSDANLPEIRAAAEGYGLKNIEFVQGMVEDTFPNRLSSDLKLGLAHIDLDIYHAIRHCQWSLEDHMVEGGYIIYDDATASTCIGATQAVEEMIARDEARSEQIFPHYVFRAQPKSLARLIWSRLRRRR